VTKNIRVLVLFFSLLALLSFYFFSRGVKQGFLRQTDFNFTVVLQNHVPTRFDSLWEIIALPVTPVPSVVIVGLMTLIAFFNKRIRFRACIIPVLFGLLVLGEMYGKSVVHHPAPPFFMIKNPTTIFPQFYVNEQYSYPSGHTARAVFLGLALYLSFIIYHLSLKKELKILIEIGIIAYISMVAIGRIYLGHHWLSDVIGGGLLGSAMGLAALIIL